MDVFASFGVALPRYSSLQARAGNMVVDLTKAKSSAERLSLMDEAHARGIVLLHFPGHIMLYLGELGGAPFAISAISEFVTPCQGAGDQVSRLDKIVVSGLEIGRGAERSSYIERLSRLAVFGR